MLAFVLAFALACTPEPRRGAPSTTLPATSPYEPAWADAPVDGLVLARRFTLLDPPAPCSVACTLADDPEEVHVLAGDGTGDLVLYGLLADADYDCVLTAGDGSVARSFHTDPLPDGLPTWTVTGTGGWGAYTLFNHFADVRSAREAKLLLVDAEGRLRWYYFVPYNAPDLDANYLGEGRVLYGGGYSAPPTVIDLAGVVELEAPAATTGRKYNHVADRLPTGEFVSIAVATNTAADGDTWDGSSIEVLDAAMAGQTWTWNTQRGRDEGWLPLPDPDVWDPYHMNAVQQVGDAMYANFRALSRFVKLDRATGDEQWQLGPEGDFLLVDDAGAPDLIRNWFFHAHAPEVEDDGRVLFYDNGSGRPGGSYTRVAEFELDEVARTARLTWDWTEDGWYETVWGDVDRLPDGHVLVTRAHCGVCQPYDPDTTQLVEVDPETDEVVWRLVLSSIHDAGYRAERLDGCAIFANRRYCPTVRLAQK